MRQVSPREVFARVARQLPDECRSHLVVVGSLAAAYHLFGDGEEAAVRTKDMDCLLVPRIEAVPQGQAVASALLAAGFLASANVSLEEFRIEAERLLVDAIDPLARMARPPEGR